MSSSVFFRFKSQKEPSRVTFDGTGISVFELKRDIIAQNKLGDGTDFELVINSEDTAEEYDDDTSIIPRSTTVIAKRLPATKPGRGGAARYVSGKMPQSAKNNHRQDVAMTKPMAGMPATSLNVMRGAQTEDEKIAAMFQLGADDWAQQQQQMANTAPVHRPGLTKGKPQNLPDHPPPSGYVCYRCGEKGHWIMECPTNNDPTFDGRPRIKRTTGIPKSFLKTIEKPTALLHDGIADDTKQPTGVMVNSEGQWVVAEPDQAAWDKYQAQAKVSAAAQNAAVQGNKRLKDQGLECTIDKRLFVDPTKTPCCQMTYCRECIQNALLDNDLRCPQCSAHNVPIDDLVPDEEVAAKVRRYEEESNDLEGQGGEPKTSFTKGAENELRKLHESSPSKSPAIKPKPPRSQPPGEKPSKKRAADSPLESDRKVQGPNNIKTSSTNLAQPKIQRNQSNSNEINDKQPSANGINDMERFPLNPPPFPNMNSFIGGGIGIPMSTNLQNPMMMPTTQFVNNQWGNMWGVGHPQNMTLGASPFQNGAMYNCGVAQQVPYDRQAKNYPGVNGIVGTNQFANQQRLNNEEESAYFRKPVNPNRQYNRRNWNQNRPADYREI